jgi:alpha/beta superfamily hydrolase
MIAERAITFSSGSIALEGRLAIPANAACAVVICHPHPQYGGDMDNDVVTGLAAHLQGAGMATLRFNFRGTGGSEGSYAHGVGEADDARAAVACLRHDSGRETVTISGYSFGAMVGLMAGHDHAHVDRLIAIAPPLPMFDVAFLRPCAKAKLFLLGDRDQYCPYSTLEKISGELDGRNQLHRLAGADHFLAGSGEEIGRAVVAFLTQEQAPAHA